MKKTGGRLVGIGRALYSFSQRERRGILLFVPLAVVVSLLAAALLRPRFSPELQLATDIAEERVGDDARPGQQKETGSAAEPALFRFDPNTATYRDFRTLGLDAKTAAGIVKYRTAGKVFRIPEDFAACHGVSDSVYFALEPYIDIAPRYALPARGEASPARPGPGAYAAVPQDRAARRDSLFAFDPNTLSAEGFVALGFSPRQATAIIARREQIRGFRSVQEFAECYVVSPEAFARLEPYLNIAVPEKKIPARIELNGADSVALLSVSGIGSLTAGRIVAYRRALGGFVRAEQLAEVRGMTEQNYERILQQIFVDDSEIQKIDINFALPEKLSGHPYIPPEVLRRIVKNRQLKGGWTTPESMVKDGTLTDAQAAKLRPYLVFNSNP